MILKWIVHCDDVAKAVHDWFLKIVEKNWNLTYHFNFTTKIDNDFQKVLEYRNSFNLIKHKNLTKDTMKWIQKRLKEYSLDEIMTSIKNYIEIVQNRNTFFKYKWTLCEFITRDNWMPVFLHKTTQDYMKSVPQTKIENKNYEEGFM